MNAPRLAVSIGCPSGIGPEVSVAAASSMRGARIVLVGDMAVLRRAARAVDVDTRRLVRVDSAEEGFALRGSTLPVFQPTKTLASADCKPGTPRPKGGAAQLAWIDTATDLVARGAADAIVTGPVNKEIIARSGARGSRGFRGHTEHLATRLGAKEVTMAFVTEALTASLVTMHLPIKDVPRAITSEAVARAAYWTAWFIGRTSAKAPRPKVAVASLNPHAGEGGLLGHEERRAIEPGIARANARLRAARIDVELVGPVPAESAFRLAARGAFRAVVAMYHDQATIPMKLLGFGEAVNVSLGLPIIRTSVDHGTAYDRAGKGTADSVGMREAMRLAMRLAPSGERKA